MLEARRGGRGGTQDRRLLLFPFVMRGSSSESFRGGGEREDTRNVHQLLNCGANVEEEIGVCRGMLDGHQEESIHKSIGRQCKDTRC